MFIHESFQQPICGLDEACLTEDRLRLDLFPATTRLRFLTPGALQAPPRPLTNLRLAMSRALRHLPAGALWATDE